MNSYIYITSISCLLLFSCKKSSNESVLFHEFEKKYELFSQENSDKLIYNYVTLHKYKDQLLVYWQYTSDKCLFLYNIENLYITSASGKIGNGPGEIASPGAIAIDEKNENIWITDLIKAKIWKFPLDSLKTPGYIPSFSVTVPTELMPIFDLKMYNDSLFALIAQSGDKEITLLSTTGNIHNSFGRNVFPKKAEMNDYGYLETYSKQLAVNPKNNKIVTSYRFYDIINGISMNGENLFTTIGPDIIEQEFKYNGGMRIPDPDQLSAYGQIYSDKKYIYSLYSGDKTFYKGGPTRNFYDYLNIFDWDGKPVAQFKFDSEVWSFCIFRDLNKIYTWNPTVENSLNIYHFNFNELK